MSDRRCHPFSFEGSLEEFDRREAEAAAREAAAKAASQAPAPRTDTTTSQQHDR